ncbi:hypothetical protein Lalb_Chr00c42g0412551 [Lupinus albus]|uniref:Uncharacterized protein n=1 Tax=Lupinus albus TaxID=3870 RepID=A0A6A4MIB5_LUPAL|nr:hypothetical protein Lalb_Chr00c42g0412551 [Lupinus albus]
MISGSLFPLADSYCNAFSKSSMIWLTWIGFGLYCDWFGDRPLGHNLTSLHFSLFPKYRLI